MARDGFWSGGDSGGFGAMLARAGAAHRDGASDGADGVSGAGVAVDILSELRCR